MVYLFFFQIQPTTQLPQSTANCLDNQYSSLHLTMQNRNLAPSFSFLLQTAFWVIAFVFMTYLSFVSYGWPHGLWRVSLIFTCHFINFYLFYSWIIPQYYQQKKYRVGVAWLLSFLIILTPLRYLIEQHFLVAPGSLRSAIARNGGLLVFVIFSELGIAGFASLLRLAVSDAHNKERLAIVEKMHLQAELRFLKAQMNPHFLFNTINNIYSLTVLKSDKAPEALMKLSQLLRYLLYECHTQVPVSKELAALDAFVELFCLRHETALNLSIHTTIQDQQASIEPLLFIPLLENAVKHSAIGLSPDAYVTLHLTQEENRITLLVENSKGEPAVASEPGGIGLQNIRRRLEVIYPQQYGFRITDTRNLFLVELSIPLMHQNNSHETILHHH